MFTRRRFLIGSATVLVMPAVVQAANLMPVRALDPALLRPKHFPNLYHPRCYVLGADGKTPVPVRTLTEWAARWRPWHVALTPLPDGGRISTVFLGLDHSYQSRFHPSAAPVLFETMVFDRNGESRGMDRYSTWDEAERGHAKMLAAMSRAA